MISTAMATRIILQTAFMLCLSSTLAVQRGFGAGSASQLLTIPPQFWCDTDETAAAAGVSASCNRYTKSMYGQKLNVTLLYETLCPDCHHFVLDVLYPNLWNDFKDIINVELVPYGNARETPGPHGTFNTTCQHGPVECALNQLSTCAVYYIKKTETLLPYAACIVQTGGSKDPETTMEDCFEETQISPTIQDKIRNCWDSALGAQLEHQMALRTQSVGPTAHTFVPWILVNGVSTMGIQTAVANSLVGMTSVLCSAYRGSSQPDACQSDAILQYGASLYQ